MSIIEVEVRHEHSNSKDSHSGAATATYHANGMMQGDPTKVAIAYDQQIACSRNKSVPVIQSGPPGVAGSEEANWDNTVPVKHSHTGIQNRWLWPAATVVTYITVTVTPERTLLSVGEWPLHIAAINL
jgi:hypothetical protein